MPKCIRIGSRGSALALRQAQRVQDLLTTHFPELEVPISIIQTEGDLNKEASLSVIGGKGVFIKALEESLSHHDIDVAVHSLKDVTTQIPDMLMIGAYLQAESIRDVFISKNHTLETLPTGATVGTGSIRRKALLKKRRPDLKTIPIRGNIDTRLTSYHDVCDGIILSEAGLMRLGLTDYITQRLSPETFYPAPGQGVIALEIRRDDPIAKEICSTITDDEQSLISRLEWEFVKAIGFDCQVPLGMATSVKNKEIHMKIFLATPSLETMTERSLTLPCADPFPEVIAYAKDLAMWAIDHES